METLETFLPPLAPSAATLILTLWRGDYFGIYKWDPLRRIFAEISWLALWWVVFFVSRTDFVLIQTSCRAWVVPALFAVVTVLSGFSAWLLGRKSEVANRERFLIPFLAVQLLFVIAWTSYLENRELIVLDVGDYAPNAAKVELRGVSNSDGGTKKICFRPLQALKNKHRFLFSRVQVEKALQVAFPEDKITPISLDLFVPSKYTGLGAARLYAPGSAE